MAERCISQDEYDTGKFGCAVPDEIYQGWVYVQRRPLKPATSERFAREVLVLILNKDEEAKLTAVSFVDRSDEGDPLPGGPKNVYVDYEGILLPSSVFADEAEAGYLVGGVDPAEFGGRVTFEALCVPALVSRKTSVGTQEAAALPLQS